MQSQAWKSTDCTYVLLFIYYDEVTLPIQLYYHTSVTNKGNLFSLPVWTGTSQHRLSTHTYIICKRKWARMVLNWGINLPHGVDHHSPPHGRSVTQLLGGDGIQKVDLFPGDLKNVCKTGAWCNLRKQNGSKDKKVHVFRARFRAKFHFFLIAPKAREIF